MAGKSRVVYVLQDAGRPDLVKIGKDSAWPLRFRQACCTSPREIRCLAAWRFAESDALGAAEKAARRGFAPYDTGNGNTEWFVGAGPEAVAQVAANLGRRPDEDAGAPGKRSWHGVEPWDAWRDTAKYTRTGYRRRLWLGAEIGQDGALGVLKAVHSPYYDAFFQFTPTYACACLRWIGWWQAPRGVDDAGNRDVYDAWRELVAAHGQGPDDVRVGWLRDADGGAAVGLGAAVRFLEGKGLVAGDPAGPKPSDAPPKDSSLGGKAPIPYGAVPDQRMITRVKTAVHG